MSSFHMRASRLISELSPSTKYSFGPSVITFSGKSAGVAHAGVLDMWRLSRLR